MNKLDNLLLEYDKAKVLDVAQNAALERYREAVRKEALATAERIKKAEAGKGEFNVKKLVFAASFRCVRGTGMAYPEGIGMHGAWYCSAILLGQAKPNSEHTPAHPFMFYEVKSECQPSAHGVTTRPSGTHIETIPTYACTNCKNTGQGASYRVERRENLKAIVCSKCGERYINEDGSCNSKISTRFFHQVVDDTENEKREAKESTVF